MPTDTHEGPAQDIVGKLWNLCNVLKDQGQQFDRQSFLHGPPGEKQPRDRLFPSASLDLRLALRGVLGLAVPLLSSQVFAQPELTAVGVAALLLAFGDLAGGEGQLRRLLGGTLAGAFAVACGVLAGGHWALAALGMAIWGVGVGLCGVYGAAAAAMGLPVAWAYLEVGLSATTHTLAHAAWMAGLFALGGLWAIVLARWIGALNPLGPLRCQVAQGFALLAAYLHAAVNPHTTAFCTSTSAVAPETELRTAIAKAQSLASWHCARQQGMEPDTLRLVALIAILDRGFALAAALAELAGREHAHAIAAELALLLDHASNIARGDALPPGLAPSPFSAAAVAHPGGPVRELLAPLRLGLDRHSLVARHALRYGLVLAVAVAIDKGFAPPFGYWIPLTASVVLQPYAGSTLQRAGQRLLGTAAGIAVGMALIGLATSTAAKTALMLAAFFLSLAVLPLDYALAIGFLSVGIVPFEALLAGAAAPEVGLLRLLATLLGGGLALAGGFLLWPAFESRGLPACLSTALRSLAAYADLVLGVQAGERVDPQRLAVARQRLGVALTNAQTTLQRLLGELSRGPLDLAACQLATAMLQRLFVSLTALRELPPATQPSTALAPFRAHTRAMLEQLADALASGRPVASSAVSAGPGPAQHLLDQALLAELLQRISLQLSTLRQAALRLSGGSAS